MMIEIRKENSADVQQIDQVVIAAFENHPYSNKAEHILVNKLREAGVLSISLVAVVGAKVVGHIAFSPVTIDGKSCDWYGLGPVSVTPALQRQGIGSALIKKGLAELHNLGARGCVLLGEPDYYERFGFKVCEGLSLAGVPAEYFLALPFADQYPRGEVLYHKSFEVCEAQ